LKRMIAGTNAIWQSRGGTKTILDEEQPVIDFAYATVVTIAPVKAGETFSKDNIWVKRPGVGPIHANRIEDVLRKKATQDIPADIHVSPEHIVDFK
jgi:sialic acid synthase SpsE